MTLDLLRRIMVWAAIFVAGLLAGIAQHKLISDRKIAKMQADWSANVAAAVEERERLSEEYRAREKALIAQRDAARKEADDAKGKNEELAGQVAVLAPVAAAVPRLRDRLETSRLASQAAGDSLGACNARARTYEAFLAGADRAIERVERSLESCRDLASASSHAHDDRAVEVISLVKGWSK